MQLYVIIDNTTAGPFERNALRDMIADGSVDPNAYSFYEGMPDWRVLSETLVWADASILNPIGHIVEEQLQQTHAGNIKLEEAAREINKGLFRYGITVSQDEMASFMTIFRTNLELRANLRTARLSGPELWPCWEMVVKGELIFPRDWDAEWLKAGGVVSHGRYIAPAVDPVWKNLSDFDLPIPPFSVDSSISMRDIRKKEAEELGVDVAYYEGFRFDLPETVPLVLIRPV